MAEEGRLVRAFEHALAVALILPLGVIGCAQDTARSRADASPPKDACVPSLQKVFFGTVDGSPECRATQRLACGLPERVRVLDGGCTIAPSDCRALCPSYGALNCQVTDASCVGGHVARDAPISVSCDFCPGGIGRRPAGLVVPASRSHAGVLATYFERAAFLEAASVRAFVELREALVAFGAPDALCAAARRAATDETVHLRMTARLSRRFGGHAPASARARRPFRVPPLDALARENAVEGCIRETYGALVAAYQARAAHDAAVRSTMEIIARDETRHAALSWAIARWAAARLDPEARTANERAAGDAISRLYGEIVDPDADLVGIAGLPTAREQKRLLRELEVSIWS